MLYPRKIIFSVPFKGDKIMEKRQIGNSQLYSSVIGYGAWATGKIGWGEVNEHEVKKAIRRAYDLGVNFFDTAPVYGLGESERIVGESLKGIREDVLIASKCGLIWDDHGKIRKHNGKVSILKEIDASLKRLNTDYIDLYQVHWPDEHTPIEETMDALNEILDAGKAKYVGVSNFSVEQIEEAKKYAPIISLQSQYNILQRNVEDAVYPYVEKENISFIPYSPLAQGLLTGKFAKGYELHEKDVRHFNPLFKGDELYNNSLKVEALQGIADKYERPLSQLAINWLISKQNVVSVICGAKTVKQVEENTRASEWKLNAEDIVTIDKLITGNR
jgi:aryl-alcohol dehydrogenase-like predicted oxidoreductase